MQTKDRTSMFVPLQFLAMLLRILRTGAFHAPVSFA
jgi:hypothetical protein